MASQKVHLLRYAQALHPELFALPLQRSEIANASMIKRITRPEKAVIEFSGKIGYKRNLPKSPIRRDGRVVEGA
jgi:hypothetical protein